MPNSYPRDGIFIPHHTTIKDSYIIEPVCTCWDTDLCSWDESRKFCILSIGFLLRHTLVLSVTGGGIPANKQFLKHISQNPACFL